MKLQPPEPPESPEPPERDEPPDPPSCQATWGYLAGLQLFDRARVYS